MTFNPVLSGLMNHGGASVKAFLSCLRLDFEVTDLNIKSIIEILLN